jgi:putative ABC transport system permease protein
MSKKWLEGFAFHHGVNYVPFLIAGVVVLFISLITVSYHSVKAALLNPVNTLRSE